MLSNRVWYRPDSDFSVSAKTASGAAIVLKRRMADVHAADASTASAPASYLVVDMRISGTLPTLFDFRHGHPLVGWWPALLYGRLCSGQLEDDDTVHLMPVCPI